MSNVLEPQLTADSVAALLVAVVLPAVLQVLALDVAGVLFGTRHFL